MAKKQIHRPKLPPPLSHPTLPSRQVTKTLAEVLMWKLISHRRLTSSWTLQRGLERGGLLETGAYSQSQMITLKFFYPMFCGIDILFYAPNAQNRSQKTLQFQTCILPAAHGANEVTSTANPTKWQHERTPMGLCEG